MSVTLFGRGKLRIASRYFWQGRTWLGVISKPANSTVSCPNTNSSRLRIMPLLPQVSNQSTAWKKLPSMLSDHRSASSIHFVLSGICETISSKWQEKTVPRSYVSLWCGLIAKSSPLCYEGGEVSVIIIIIIKTLFTQV